MSIRNRIVVVDYGMGNIHSIVKKSNILAEMYLCLLTQMKYLSLTKSFWGYAKTRLVKFKGMNKNIFELHLKECEFRFNNRKQNLYKILLEICKKELLNKLRSKFNLSMCNV